MRFNKILIGFICLLCFSVSAQSWQTLGSAQFSPGNVGFLSSAINSLGTPYVAFQDNANSSKTTVMKFDGANWVLVGSAGFSSGSASWQSLAIDNSGTPYVAFQDMGNSSKTTVMKFGGTGWVVVGAAGFSAGTARHQSLAIDNSGTPYVAYADGPYVYVMKFNGSSWVSVGGAAVSANSAEYPSLAIDNNVPYVAYQDDDNSQKLTVKKFNGTNWVTVGIENFSAGIADFISLAINSLGVPYVAYGDGSIGGEATVATFNGSAWTTVGSAGFSTGSIASMQIKFDNNVPYVAFSNIGTTYKTDVMKFDGSNWVGVGTPNLLANGWAFAHDIEIHNGILYVSYIDGNKATTITYDNTVSLNEAFDSNTNKLSVFPNPVNDVLQITSEFEIQKISILEGDGKFIKSSTENAVSISELSTGIYIVQVQTTNGLITKRFVKK